MSNALAKHVSLAVLATENDGAPHNIAVKREAGVAAGDPTWGIGLHGPVLDFDGTGDGFQFPAREIISIDREFTVAVGFTSRASDGNVIFSLETDAGADRPFALYHATSSSYRPFAWGFNDSTSSEIWKPTTLNGFVIPFNVFNHVVISYNGAGDLGLQTGSNFVCYWNQKFEIPVVGSSGFGNADNRTDIGQHSAGSYFNGTIDYLVALDGIAAASRLKTPEQVFGLVKKVSRSITISIPAVIADTPGVYIPRRIRTGGLNHAPKGLIRPNKSSPQYTGLVGWWPGIDEINQEVIHDHSGRGNHATWLANDPKSKFVPEVNVTTPDNNNTNDVCVGDAIIPELQNAVHATLAIWFRRSAAATYGGIGYGYDGSNRMHLGGWTDGNIYCTVDGAFTDDGGANNDTDWHHGVMVFDGTLTGVDRARVYIDGVLSHLGHGATPSTLSNSINSRIRLGHPVGGIGASNRCTWMDARAYRVSWSATMVAQAYAGGRWGLWNPSNRTISIPVVAGAAPAYALTNPTEAIITQTAAQLGVTLDTAGGALYAYVKQGAAPSQPSTADLISGSGAAFHGSIP